MKVLITFYDLNNLGGIINNQEALYAGLRELGHDVTVKLLVWKEEIRAAKSHRHLTPETGVMGLSFDQELGWYWPAEFRFAYKGEQNLLRWKEFASKFDLIIWQIPVPTMQKQNRGNLDWLELYDVPVKQVAYVHDGNMEDSYPWIYAIVEHLCGAAGTHPCAYHSLANLPIRRALAFTAQMNIDERMKAADKKQERNGWFSLQTFKAWKRVDELVRAVPYMTNGENMILSGGGLHMYYMTSKDKMKKEYIGSAEKDPDIDEALIGKPIWDSAIERGMEYTGYLSNAQRETELHSARCLIDPSWSFKYAGIGDHINRTPIDGMIGGCLPICRNLGVATNIPGIGEFMRPDVNYIMVPWNATPKEFAEIVDYAIYLPEPDRRRIVEAGRTSVVPWFEYRRVAQTFIDLARGKPAGVYRRREPEMGVHNPEMEKEGLRHLNEFFGADPLSYDNQPEPE